MYDKKFLKYLGLSVKNVPYGYFGYIWDDYIHIGNGITCIDAAGNNREILDSYCIAVDASHNLYLASSLLSKTDVLFYDHHIVNNLFRITWDGSIDKTFDIGIDCDFNLPTTLTGKINKLFIDASNNLLVGGNFSKWNGQQRINIVKLTKDGSIDTTFIKTFTTLGTNVVNDIVQDSTNYYYLIDREGNKFHKVSPDGSLNTTVNLTVNTDIWGAVIDSSDNLYISGVGKEGGFGTDYAYIRRYKSDCTLDTTFDVSEYKDATSSTLRYSILKIKDGSIYCAKFESVSDVNGYNGYKYYPEILRFNNLGERDFTYDTSTIFVNDFYTTTGDIHNMEFFENNLLVTGDFVTRNNNYGIVKLNDSGNIASDGSVGSGLINYYTSPDPSIELPVYNENIAKDGSILYVYGSFTKYKRCKTPMNSLVKIDEYGNSYTITDTFGTVTDIDGNVYNTILISGKVWMVDNLKTTRLNDGTPINYVTDNTTWANTLFPSYCWYNNDPSNGLLYGALYNHRVAALNNIAPIGWHVPTIKEIIGLYENYQTYAYKDPLHENIRDYDYSIRWRSKGTTTWNLDIGLDYYKFGAVGSGGRTAAFTHFYELKTTFYMWANDNYLTIINGNNSRMYTREIQQSTNDGMSIRCVKD